MKKVAIVIMTLLLCCLYILGCQPTPSEDIIGSKNARKLLEALKNVGADPQTLDIPERYDFEKPICNNKAIWRIQADVFFTDADALPVYAAEITPFSVQELENAVTAFFGEGAILTKSSDLLSKNAIIEQFLAPAQQTLAAIQAGKKAYDNAGEITEAFMQQRIKIIQRRINNAPDTDTLIPLSWQNIRHCQMAYMPVLAQGTAIATGSGLRTG